MLLLPSGFPTLESRRAWTQRAAVWRGELAGRRVLLVLDNALNSAQVRPLLPGSASCAVMITSRRRLTGLNSAEVLSLDTLPPDDAVALFRAVAGPDRCEAEPTTVVEVVKLCGHLPLAISIAAARLRTRPQWTVFDLVERLADDHRRTRLLQSEDRGVTAAFPCHINTLSMLEQRMFRLLGMHPGSDIDVFAAAALVGLTVDEAENLLDALCDMHLLIPHLPGRYRLHDLVRDFARASVEARSPHRNDRPHSTDSWTTTCMSLRSPPNWTHPGGPASAQALDIGQLPSLDSRRLQKFGRGSTPNRRISLPSPGSRRSTGPAKPAGSSRAMWGHSCTRTVSSRRASRCSGLRWPHAGPRPRP